MSSKYIFKNTLKQNKFKHPKKELNINIKNSFLNYNLSKLRLNTIESHRYNLFTKELTPIKNALSLNDSNSKKDLEINTNFSNSKLSKNYSLLMTQTIPLDLNSHKNTINKNDYIKLNTLFTLPTIDKKFIRYNSNRSIKIPKNIFLNNFINNKYKNDSNKNNKLRFNLFNQNISIAKSNNESKYNNLYSFMKLKYYEDVNERLEKKLRDESFIDRGVKDKLIKMGKVGIFWKNVIEYCSPLLFEEKYKNMKKIINNKKNKFSCDEKPINKNNGFDRILYTSMLRSKIIHSQSRNKEKLFI